MEALNISFVVKKWSGVCGGEGGHRFFLGIFEKMYPFAKNIPFFLNIPIIKNYEDNAFTEEN